MNDMSFTVESSYNKSTSQSYQIDLKVENEPISIVRGLMENLAGTEIRNAVARGETIDAGEIGKRILDSFEKYVPGVGVKDIKVSLSKQNKR